MVMVAQERRPHFLALPSRMLVAVADNLLVLAVLELAVQEGAEMVLLALARLAQLTQAVAVEVDGPMALLAVLVS